MELKGSRTEANLLAAFAGESQARNKYDYAASQANKEGYEQIASIFEETARNEKEHAKMWFKLVNDGKIGNTSDYEHTDMYKEFAQVAREEGFNDIAELFEGVGAIEKEHEERFLTLLKNLESDMVFKSEEETIWVCRNCGHVYRSKEALDVCPVCKHGKAYQERKATNY